MSGGEREVLDQCPHEVIRATCGGCNCPCDSCVRLNAERTPTTHPDDATCAAPTSDDCLPVRVEEE